MEPPAGAAPASTRLQRKPAGCREEAKWSQSPVLPWTQRAYETCLSAGSTAMWSDDHQNGAPPRNCTRLACLPSRRIAQNALGASKMAGARRLAHPRLPGSKPGGSAIPREPRSGNNGVPDRLWVNGLRSQAGTPVSPRCVPGDTTVYLPC
jgi:hypothetical protein